MDVVQHINPLTDKKNLGGFPEGHLLYIRYLARNNVYTRYIPLETLVVTSIDVKCQTKG